MMKSLTMGLMFGLLAAPATAQLLANDTDNSRLVGIDIGTGSASPFGTHLIPGNVTGLTYQASTGTVYGISNTPFGAGSAFNGIYTFDVSDGSAALAPITQVTPHPIDVVSALAAHPTENKLFALQTGSPTRSALWEIDLDAGTYNQLTVDFDPFMSGLTFTNDGRLLASSADFFTSTGTLYEVDLDSVTASPLATSPDLLMTGLTTDPATGEIYGVFNGFGSIDTVFSIDALTGQTSPIATLDLGNLNAVTFIPTPGGIAPLIAAFGMAARRRRAH